ncbi:hypothetical protein HP572_13050 [Pectobacterium sp. PL64]|uniref:hypothetical protein n=1 Tax=Pectobacterium sp. PL64 TaxID=2738983 RepID=UPI001F0C6DAE|nr:hypothetical protein [Pectobacterium sp. PL64]UMO86321.1 hypothetical protein HP572_13050 [Pectobacterium sp. PL64]
MYITLQTLKKAKQEQAKAMKNEEKSASALKIASDEREKLQQALKEFEEMQSRRTKKVIII